MKSRGIKKQMVDYSEERNGMNILNYLKVLFLKD